jgi:preprotein translocase subunit SecG
MSFLTSALITLQIIVSILLVIVVMLQSSDEDTLSGIGSGSMQSRLLSHKSSVDLITKITIFLGIVFMLNSFLLVSVYTRQYSRENKSVIQDYLKESGDTQKSQEVIKNFQK